MKRLVIVLLAFLCWAAPPAARAADQTDDAKQLMVALGFDAMVESMRVETYTVVQRQVSSMVSQFRQAGVNLSDATMEELKNAAHELGRRILSSWNTDEAARIYAASLAEGLPEPELHHALEHYKTEEGQHELKVINDAVNRTNNYILSSVQKETDTAMKDFMLKIRRMVEKETLTKR